MSHDLRSQVQAELALLRRIPGAYADLIEESRTSGPSLRDLAALAAVLQSTYTGMERVLRYIAEACDGGVRKSESWHVQLLNSMVEPSAGRPAVVSDDLLAVLREYLGFRHVFHHAYALDLQWSRMKRLVLGLEETLNHFGAEIESFLDRLDAFQAPANS